jgi:hypothetical protein
VDADPAEPRKCLNCSTALPGEYCPNCGQRDYDFNRSFREIAGELAESFWNFDSKLFRGVVDLLCKPGFLTAEYLAGRRASQVPPLRFYLFVSILFFLTSATVPADNLITLDPGDQAAALDGVPLDPFTRERILTTVDAARKRTNELSATERRAMEFLTDKYERRHEIAKTIAENLPKLVFACLPVFALITRVVFRRARLGFLAHLVMALHLHSFYFLFRLVASGWAMLAELVSPWMGGILSFSAVVYTIVYAFMAARRVFGASRAGTFWRLVFAGLLYLAALGIGFLILTAIVFLLA